jgi:hypothetical protein
MASQKEKKFQGSAVPALAMGLGPFQALAGRLLSGTLLIGLGTGLAVTAAGAGRAPRPAAEPRVQTTARDRTALAVTVYNTNLALVREVREVRLPAGRLELEFSDVPAAIQSSSVQLRSLSSRAALTVLDQSYEYDLLNPAKLLEKYVGREVLLVRKEQEGGSTRYVPVQALLLADNNGPVWKIGNEIVTGMAADSYRFPELPAGLYTRPTLLVAMENKQAGLERLEATYLTSGMNWSADYALAVEPDEKSAVLSGWVTLANSSGAAYQDARLELVAGQIHRVEPPGPRPLAAAAGRLAGAEAAFAQQPVSEYHLYTLGRAISIADNETKQIALVSPAKILVEKHYVVEGQPSYFFGPIPAVRPLPQGVNVYFQFRNEKKAGLGVPLPAGTVRVFETGPEGAPVFLGEDQIQHTPADETVRVRVGAAFDIVAERKQTDYRVLAPNLYEVGWAITLRNHKNVPVTVEVREPAGQDWQVLSSNFPWKKLDASTLGFEIPVPANGSATLEYRLRVRRP